MAYAMQIDFKEEVKWEVADFCSCCDHELTSNEIGHYRCCPYCGWRPVANKEKLDTIMKTRHWVYDVDEPKLRAGCEEEGHWEYKYAWEHKHAQKGLQG